MKRLCCFEHGLVGVFQCPCGIFQLYQEDKFCKNDKSSVSWNPYVSQLNCQLDCVNWNRFMIVIHILLCIMFWIFHWQFHWFTISYFEWQVDSRIHNNWIVNLVLLNKTHLILLLLFVMFFFSICPSWNILGVNETLKYFKTIHKSVYTDQLIRSKTSIEFFIETLFCE